MVWVGVTTSRRTGTRRAPAEARALILAGAERVFSKFMPDEVGLRDVAEETGVSHALLTHYFGTYNALVEATLDRRVEALRGVVLERLLGSSVGELPLVPVLRSLMDDRLTMRLITWSILSGRARSPDFFVSRVQGLKLIVTAIEAGIRSRGKPVPPRRVLEFALMSALALSIGFAVSGDLMHTALGHDEPVDVAALCGEIQKMVDAYVSAALASTPT